MKVSYDPEIDAIYIRLLESVHQCKTLRLTDDRQRGSHIVLRQVEESHRRLVVPDIRKLLRARFAPSSNRQASPRMNSLTYYEL
jgi:hypothetical protein